MPINKNLYELETLFEEGKEYLDFSKSEIAMQYLKARENQMRRIPKYIPEELDNLYSDLYKRICTQREVFKEALRTLYNNQTNDEKDLMHTIYKNIEGFNRSEAKYLTKMARIAEERPLSINEVATCIPALRKYVVQLMLESEFMSKIGMGFEYRTMVLSYAAEIQEIRKRG